MSLHNPPVAAPRARKSKAASNTAAHNPVALDVPYAPDEQMVSLPSRSLSADEAVWLDLFARSAVSFNRSYVDVAGSVTGALWLSYAITIAPSDSEGRFQFPQELCTQVTGLTRREQESARARLRSIGVLLEKRTGRHSLFKLDLHRLIALLKDHTQLVTSEEAPSEPLRLDTSVTTPPTAE